MSHTLSKYIASDSPVARSNLRNSLAIRLVEEFKGINRHYTDKDSVCFFSLFTLDDVHYVHYDYANKVLNWQGLFQKMFKRLKKLYPFLTFSYAIFPEFSPKKDRLHFHSTIFCRPNCLLGALSCRNTPTASDVRQLSVLSAINSNDSVVVRHLQSNSKSHSNTTRMTKFQSLIYKVLKQQWVYGLSEHRLLTSTLGVKYVTKYVTKSRDERFYRHVPAKAAYIERINRGTWIQEIIHSAIKAKKIYKCYLISRGIGSYFFETEQYKRLFDNLKVEKKAFTIPCYFEKGELLSTKKVELFVTPSLRWYDNEDPFSKKGFSLPLYYRQHLYNEKYPLGTYERALVSTAGIQKLEFSFFKKVASLCIDNGYDFWLQEYNPCEHTDNSYRTPILHNGLAPSFELKPNTYPHVWKKINDIYTRQFNSINQFKSKILWSNQKNHSLGGLVLS